jgi:membrane protease YdiL (CAAX protease family)
VSTSSPALGLDHRARAIGAEALSWLAVPAGLALLLARLWLTGAGGSNDAAVVAIFVALAAISLAAASAPAGAHPLPVAFVVAIGVGAVAVAAFASTLPGPALPSTGGVAALALVVGAGVAEEAFFRRLLYGRLLRWGAAPAVVGSAVAFGLLHIPLHGTAAFPVDLGAGLFLSWQRWASGTWGAPAATHAFANALVVLR